MDVLLDEEEATVRDTMRKFLAAECPPNLVRASEKEETAYSRVLWKKMAELGWLGIALPERHGGQGLPLTYLGLLLEEAGRHLAPVPLHSATVAAYVLSRYGSGEQLDWIARMVNADAILSYAVQGPDGRWDALGAGLIGRREGGRWRLTGTRTFVDNFRISDRCLVLFQDDVGEVSAALLDPKAAGIQHLPLVPTAKDGQDRVSFQAVEVLAEQIVAGGKNLARDLCDFAALATAAQMAGAARRDMEFAVAHAKMREAFGQPIGAFQVIQHMLVDMLIAVDGVDLLTREAFWRLENGLQASVEASQAKAFASDQCVVVARSSQQIHGGMGFMLEFDLHLWYRRIASWSLRCGTTIEHRRLVAQALLDRPGTVRLGASLAI